MLEIHTERLIGIIRFICNTRLGLSGVWPQALLSHYWRLHLNRTQETEAWEGAGFDSLGEGSRLLLWHGSRSTNFAGVPLCNLILVQNCSLLLQGFWNKACVLPLRKVCLLLYYPAAIAYEYCLLFFSSFHWYGFWRRIGSIWMISCQDICLAKGSILLMYVLSRLTCA